MYKRQGETSPLPSWSYLRDLKEQYDVSTVLYAAGYFSVLHLKKTPQELLQRIYELSQEALDAFYKLSLIHISCRMQAPILDQLAEEVHEDDLKICKMDVDENPNTARQFGIMSIPTLLFKKDGQVVKQVAGVHTKAQLKEIIAELS